MRKIRKSAGEPGRRTTTRGRGEGPRRRLSSASRAGTRLLEERLQTSARSREASCSPAHSREEIDKNEHTASIVKKRQPPKKNEKKLLVKTEKNCRKSPSSSVRQRGVHRRRGPERLFQRAILTNRSS